MKLFAPDYHFSIPGRCATKELTSTDEARTSDTRQMRRLVPKRWFLEYTYLSKLRSCPVIREWGKGPERLPEQLLGLPWSTRITNPSRGF